MRCAGCNRELEIGDRYITDTSSGFTKSAEDPAADEIVAMILGGFAGKIVFCEDCTEPGGDYLYETVYGDE